MRDKLETHQRSLKTRKSILRRNSSFETSLGRKKYSLNLLHFQSPLRFYFFVNITFLIPLAASAILLFSDQKCFVDREPRAAFQSYSIEFIVGDFIRNLSSENNWYVGSAGLEPRSEQHSLDRRSGQHPGQHPGQHVKESRVGQLTGQHMKESKNKMEGKHGVHLESSKAGQNGTDRRTVQLVKSSRSGQHKPDKPSSGINHFGHEGRPDPKLGKLNRRPSES